MKLNVTKPGPKTKTQLCFFNFSIFVFLLLIPAMAFSQKGKENQKEKEIIPILECVEDNGDGTYTANFGYDNKNQGEITISESRSEISTDNGKTKEKGPNSFLPGRQFKMFSKTFRTDDNCTWILVQGNGNTKEVTSNINSAHCGKSDNIKKDFPAPEGGKVTETIKIGAELAALSELGTGTGINIEGLFQITSDGQKVMIEIFTSEVNLQTLIVYGLTEYSVYSNKITGLFPIANLNLLNDLLKGITEGTNYARPLYPPIHNNSGLGINTGDYAIYSDFVRGGYNLEGTGIKIGVFSNSYDTQGGAVTDVVNDDLPGEGNIHGYTKPVSVLKEYPAGFGSLSDEGRAMLQIVHDIAPAAELVFRTGSLGAEDFAAGIAEMYSNDVDCDIIVDDITYITEPFFKDGQLAQAVNAAHAAGIAYFTSAGNFADASYESTFQSSIAAPFDIIGMAHEFGPGDIFQEIQLDEGTYIIVLQWEEPNFNNAQTDLDIYVAEQTGYNLLGYNRNNIGEQPFEVLPLTVSKGGAKTNIIITNANGGTTPRFKYIVFRGFNGFKMRDVNSGYGSSTIIGQANAAGAMSVGAVLYSNTPFYGVDPPTIASFSSVGGMLFRDETGAFNIDRQKPDFTAPNGVETTVKMSNFDDDGDGIFQFHGTSASAPHAAAVAVLILEGRTKYMGPSTVTSPEDIRDLLQNSAIDMNNINPDNPFDYISGFGFIQADAALLEFANPKPVIKEIQLDDAVSVNAGSSIIINGFYFTNKSQVIFDGNPMAEGVTYLDHSNLQVTLPAFEGNPTIQVCNAPNPDYLKIDGGCSNVLRLFDPIKKTISITAKSYTKKYGVNMDDHIFEAEVRVGGELIRVC